MIVPTAAPQACVAYVSGQLQSIFRQADALAAFDNPEQFCGLLVVRMALSGSLPIPDILDVCISVIYGVAGCGIDLVVLL